MLAGSWQNLPSKEHAGDAPRKVDDFDPLPLRLSYIKRTIVVE